MNDPAQPAAARAPASRESYECGVCWTIYKPEEGDPFAQIPPGISFELLPENWCCPNCEAPRHKFMRVNS